MRLKGEKRGVKVMVFAIAITAFCIVTTSVSATAVSVPFEISGYVFNADGSACNGPTISITNLNTGETFSTTTLASSNYYRAEPALSSDAISDGDVLRFKVTAGTESGDIDYLIFASDLNRGALQFDVTFGEREGEIKGEVSIAEEEQTPDQTPLLPPLPGGPGPIATPVVTPTPEEGQTPVPTATATSTPATPLSEEGKGKGIQGFEAAYALIGLLAISYLILRRKKG